MPFCPFLLYYYFIFFCCISLYFLKQNNKIKKKEKSLIFLSYIIRILLNENNKFIMNNVRMKVHLNIYQNKQNTKRLNDDTFFSI